MKGIGTALDAHGGRKMITGLFFKKRLSIVTINRCMFLIHSKLCWPTYSKEEGENQTVIICSVCASVSFGGKEPLSGATHSLSWLWALLIKSICTIHM